MKVLTIRQPWATLIIQKDKRFEFRSWNTKFRGEFLIHAGLAVDKEAMERLKKYLPDEIPLGKILGKATLVECHKMNDELEIILAKENNDIYTTHSFSNDYAFEMNDVVEFKNPIEVKGKLGFWNLDDSIIKKSGNV